MLRGTGPCFNPISAGHVWGTGVRWLARKRQRTAALQTLRDRVGRLPAHPQVVGVGARTATSAVRGRAGGRDAADLAVRAPRSVGRLASPTTWGWCARRRCQTLRVKVPPDRT